MRYSYNNFTHNPFTVDKQFTQAVEDIHTFFKGHVKSSLEFTSFWNSINDQELMNLTQIIQSIKQISLKDPNNYALNLILLLEGIINLNDAAQSISFRIKCLYRKGLSLSQKQEFVQSLSFSSEVNLFEQKFNIKEIPLLELSNEYSLDTHLSLVIDRIYQIRNSCVHMGILPQFICSNTKFKGKIKIYDKFAIRGRNKYIYFSSTLDIKFFEYITKKSLWNYLLQNISHTYIQEMERERLHLHLE